MGERSKQHVKQSPYHSFCITSPCSDCCGFVLNTSWNRLKYFRVYFTQRYAHQGIGIVVSQMKHTKNLDTTSQQKPVPVVTRDLGDHIYYLTRDP